MKKCRLFFFLVLFLNICFLHAQRYDSLANLNFQSNKDNKFYGWKRDPNSVVKTELDSSCFFNKKHPIKLSQMDVMGCKTNMYASLQQKVMLPEMKNCDGFEIKLTCKPQNLKESYLVIRSLDQDEAFLRTDTMFINASAEWRTYAKRISDDRVRFVHLDIRAKGADPKKTQNLLLDRMDILIGNKSIHNYMLPDVYTDSLAKKEIIPLDINSYLSFDKVQTVKEKRILAIGESIHGSETMNEIAFDLIKYRVENCNCKLVLIELPMEITLPFNRYLQGDDSFKIDSVLTQLNDLYLYSDKLKDLLVWLREFNDKTDAKVWLTGMEMDFDLLKSRLFLYDYFSLLLDKSDKYPGIKKLCSELLEGANPIKNVADIFYENGGFEELLGTTESQIIKYYFDNISYYNNSISSRYEKRDFRMQKNARFFIDLLCKSPTDFITIYSHLGHSDYVPDLYTRPMGSFLKEEYKDAYSCIGVFAKEGSCLTGNLKNLMASAGVLNSFSYSLEGFLARHNIDYLYCPTLNYLNFPLYTRALGNSYNDDQFYAMNPSSRMDGVIFIKSSSQLIKPERLLKKPINVNKWLFDKLKRLRNQNISSAENLSNNECK